MRTETVANDDVPLKTRTHLLMNKRKRRRKQQKNNSVRNVIRIRYPRFSGSMYKKKSSKSAEGNNGKSLVVVNNNNDTNYRVDPTASLLSAGIYRYVCALHFLFS